MALVAPVEDPKPSTSHQEENEPGPAVWMFDPALCADLHNKLVQHRRTIENGPVVEKRIQRNIFELPSAPTSPPDDPDGGSFEDYLGEALMEFLRLIDIWEVRSIGDELTPFANPPILWRLWDFQDFDHDGEYEYAVLLYGDAESSNTGGLFFDVQSERACWACFPGWPFPPKDEWIPLDVVLRKWLLMWEAGKIYSGPDGNGFELREWTDWELEKTLQAWDQLLDAVEARRITATSSSADSPQPSSSSSQRDLARPRGLVDAELLDRYCENGFTRAFFKSARRPVPSDLFIAPGITAFDSSSYEELYASEAEDSVRRQANRQASLHKDDLGSSLIFPSSAIVPETPGLGIDRGYAGFGKYLMQRRAGLYLAPSDYWVNSVQFVDRKGREDHFGFRFGQCPWLPARNTTVTDILVAWKRLVDDGIWHVAEHGVEGGMEWFDDIEPGWAGKKKLDDGREISLKLEWIDVVDF